MSKTKLPRDFNDREWSWSSTQHRAQSEGPGGEVADKSYPYPLEGEGKRNARRQIKPPGLTKNASRKYNENQ